LNNGLPALDAFFDNINSLGGKEDKDIEVNRLMTSLEYESLDSNQVLEHISKRLRENADDYAAIEILHRYFFDRVDPYLVAELNNNLSSISDPDTVAAAIQLGSEVKSRFLNKVGGGGNNDVDVYESYFNSSFPQVRKAALNTLLLFPLQDNAASKLTTALSDSSPDVRHEAIKIIDSGDFSFESDTVDRLLDIAEYDFNEENERNSALATLVNIDLSEAQQRRLRGILPQ